ncbi:MAG: hypothetical protein R2762_31260 [Bryobacteraceae bacterium]
MTILFKRIIILLVLACFIAVAVPARAEDHGPDVRYTGAPGDETGASCHGGTAVNACGGNLAIQLAGATPARPA